MSDTICVPLSTATRLCAELDAGENADTPETNAAERMAYSHEHMVPTDFARKLERHRDIAREKYCEALTENMLHVSTIGRLERERDEARELARTLAAFVEPDIWAGAAAHDAMDALEAILAKAKEAAK